MSAIISGVVSNGVVVPQSPLPEGAKVEVTILTPDKPAPKFGSALEFLESLPPGPRAFKTLWQAAKARTIEIVSSDLTLMETLVGPLKSGNDRGFRSAASLPLAILGDLLTP